MSELTIKGKIIEEFLSKPEFATLPTLTLARIIYNTGDNNKVFKDVEQVRNNVRRSRGQIGKESRKKLANKQFMSKPSEFYNPYNLPETDEDDREPFKLPTSCNNILLLSDIHIPYHNINAVTAALDYGKENKINTILLNGDTFDFYGISRFEKDPRKRNFQDEIDACRDFLKTLRNHFEGISIYVKWGNHEVRWESFLKTKAPELLAMHEFKLATIFRFGELFINEIHDKTLIKAGNLSILHGHEFGHSTFSPVNPARGYYNRGKSSMIAGHNHQTSEHSEKDLEGKVVTCWSTGCLCELKPDYMPFNKWNHGFAHITVSKEGSYKVKNMRIIKGKIV